MRPLSSPLLAVVLFALPALVALPAAADEPVAPSAAALGAEASAREQQMYETLRLEIETRSSRELTRRTTQQLLHAVAGAPSAGPLAAARTACRPNAAGQLECVVRPAPRGPGAANAAP